MPTVIRPFTEEWTAAVREFNRRLESGGAPEEFRFPEQPGPDWRPETEAATLYQEYFLAVEGADVRGGYVLKHQEFSFSGSVHSIAHYRLPLSEGIVDRTYAGVGAQMARQALRTQPVLFALGMGNMDRPLPRMLGALGWSLTAVPFFFRVKNTRRFLRNIRSLRSGIARKAALDVAALSGLGALVIQPRQALRKGRGSEDVRVEVIANFSDWANAVWIEAQPKYAMIAVRDSRILNLLYPADSDRFLRLKILRGEALLGWAVVLDTQMLDNRHFGNMRLGAIADGLAAPENADAVINAATRFLEGRGVDLIVANHSHLVWKMSFRQAGFLDGPSNYIFAASPKLAERIGPLEGNVGQVFLNRGDGDGPIHL